MFGDSKSIYLLCINAERSDLSMLPKTFSSNPNWKGLSITGPLGLSDNSKWPLCFDMQSGCGSGIIPVPCVQRLNNSEIQLFRLPKSVGSVCRFTSNDLKCKDERHPPSKDGRIDNRYRVRGERKKNSSTFWRSQSVTSRIKNLYYV